MIMVEIKSSTVINASIFVSCFEEGYTVKNGILLSALVIVKLRAREAALRNILCSHNSLICKEFGGGNFSIKKV